MESTASQRVKELIKKSNLTVNAFSKCSNVPQRTLSNMITRGTEPSSKTLKTILASFPNISPEWLLLGKGEMLIDAEDKQNLDNANTMEETRPRLPVTVAAGKLSGFSDGVMLSDCEQIPIITAFPPYDFTMIVQGDSMSPKIESGDEIAIKKVTEFIQWGKPHVLDTSEGAVLKTIYDAGDSFECRSYNSAYPPFNIKKESVFAIYKMVGLLRR